MIVANEARFGTEKALEPLKRIHTHLLGLINQVLDFSKIKAGKLELSLESVSLEPLIDEVIGTARQLAEHNNNRLVVEAQDDLGTLTVDPMRLRQILLNRSIGARYPCDRVDVMWQSEIQMSRRFDYRETQSDHPLVIENEVLVSVRCGPAIPRCGATPSSVSRHSMRQSTSPFGGAFHLLCWPVRLLHILSGASQWSPPISRRSFGTPPAEKSPTNR
jgi:hypothetical protein